MLFRKFTEDDVKILRGYLKDSGVTGSDYSFGSWYSWYIADKTEYAEQNGFLYFKVIFTDNTTAFLPPLGKGDFAAAVAELSNFCRSEKIPFRMVFATKEQVDCLKGYTLTLNRDNSEYVYNTSDIIGLKGKKYHSKRNHIKKFQSLYNYEFTDYTDADFDGALALMDLWISEKDDLEEQKNGQINAMAEREALVKMLRNREKLDLKVGVLKADAKIIGLSVGEVLPSGTGVVLFEKADFAYEGAYSAINNFFAVRYLSETRYINRQEDMGIEGLRTAKLSYHPQFLLDKYTVTEGRDAQLRRLYELSFDDGREFTDYFFERKILEAGVYTAEEEGLVVSALYVFDKKLRTGGNVLDTAFITAAATLPEFRGRGYIGQVIKKCLVDLYALNTPFVLLKSFKKGFYDKFGFGKLTDERKTRIAFRTYDKYLETHVTEDAALLARAYETYASGFGFSMKREVSDFEKRLAELRGGEAYAVTRKGKITGGFLKCGDTAEEVFVPNKFLRSIKELDGCAASVPGRGDGAQVRTVNLYAFVDALRFENDFSLRFKLVDRIFSANSGVFLLKAENGKASLSVSDAFDMTFTPTSFAAYMIKICACGSFNVGDCTVKGYIADAY